MKGLKGASGYPFFVREAEFKKVRDGRTAFATAAGVMPNLHGQGL